MIKVAVVILNWNRPKDTVGCLESVYELHPGDYSLEVILVDNASTDGSVAAVRSLRLIQNKENLGYAGGNNVGIRQAIKDGADFVFVLNNDTILDKNALLSLLRAAGEHKDAGIFSPKIYFAKGFEFHKDRYSKGDLGKVIWAAGGDWDRDNVLGSNHGVNEVDNNQFDKVREIDFATGAAMFVRREVFEKVGFFNQDYFLYVEDVEFCERAKKGGFKILYVPEAKLWHKVAQSSGIGSGLNDYFTTRNRLVFGLKYANMRTKIALIRESLRFLLTGRHWQKRGVVDFYLHHLGRGGFPL